MALFDRILVTNDDGIDAPGLIVARAIAESLANEVWVLAPVADQSGVGQGISMHSPLRLTTQGERVHGLTGTPADCVMYAVAGLMADAPPELVLSGVNWGANLADSVMYSGTVGAVLAADHLGLPAIAISQAFHRRSVVDFTVARSFAASAIERLWALRDSHGCCWNVNFPMQPLARIDGLRIVRQGRGSIAAPKLIAGTDGRGLAYHWLTFERDASQVTDNDTDVAALRAAQVAATPLHGARCDERLCADSASPIPIALETATATRRGSNEEMR